MVLFAFMLEDCQKEEEKTNSVQKLFAFVPKPQNHPDLPSQQK